MQSKNQYKLNVKKYGGVVSDDYLYSNFVFEKDEGIVNITVVDQFKGKLEQSLSITEEHEIPNDLYQKISKQYNNAVIMDSAYSKTIYILKKEGIIDPLESLVISMEDKKTTIAVYSLTMKFALYVLDRVSLN